MEPHSLSNSQVAGIYQNMLGGDRNALFQLQHIGVKHQLPHLSATPQNYAHRTNNVKISTEESTPHIDQSVSPEQKEFKETSSVANFSNVMGNRETKYSNALKKGTRMADLSQNEQPGEKVRHIPKRWQSSNQQYQLPKKSIKEEDKQWSRDQRHAEELQVELKVNLTVDIPMTKKGKAYALPKVVKPKIVKVQSTQMEPKKNLSEPQKKPKQQKKVERVDFRKMIGRSKQQRYQFQKNNEEELLLQMEIVNLHRSKKDYFQQIKIKYELNYAHKQKYLRRKKRPEDIYHFKNKEPEGVERVSQLDLEKSKCDGIVEDIQLLKVNFSQNVAALAKLEKATAGLVFTRFLENRADTMTEISEEEGDTVEPLETAADCKGKYRQLMALTRQKKWGLSQRSQYEAQRTQSLSNSGQSATDSRFSQNSQFRQVSPSGKQENKVTINSRLKNLLFS